jgi:hypothetical protein
MTEKAKFARKLEQFVTELRDHVSSGDGQWTVKGFIDIFKNVYTISSDTKIVSKILEIHLFPKILAFAQANGYKVVLAEHQNYYPDISFVKANDESVRFAVDFKRSGSANLNSAISGNSGHNAGPRKAWQTGVFNGQEISAAHTPYAHAGVQGAGCPCGFA